MNDNQLATPNISAHFGYNLKRALAVVGLQKLLAAVQAFKPGGRPRAPVFLVLVVGAGWLAAVGARAKKIWRGAAECGRGGLYADLPRLPAADYYSREG